jgi:hypothetical protein
MLIVNHDQLRLAGIASLEEPCTMLPVRSNWPPTCWQMCLPSSVHQHLIPRCLFSRPPTLLPPGCHAASGRKRKE